MEEREFVLRDPDGNRLIFGESFTEDQQQLQPRT
jgi:hypothetical protein